MNPPPTFAALAGLLALAAGASAALTGAVRGYALRKNVMDLPGARSSHTRPTPRGGGAAIVLVFLAGLGAATWEGMVEVRTAVGFAGAGLAVALVGFADDHGGVAARWRLAVHAAAAAWALGWMGGLPPVSFGGTPVRLGWAGDAVAVVYLVWLLNLYNFMDGIDGLAAGEAVTVGVAAALLLGWSGSGPSAWFLPACLAAASLGFAFWNWPPARIFMGDVGSGFLGLMFGLLSVDTAWRNPRAPCIWLILLGVFVADATFTLLRRMVRGEKLHQAHRSHAYQKAAVRWRSHLPVTLAIIGINCFWLAPLAAAVALGRVSAPWGLAVAYIPLACCAGALSAGAREPVGAE